MKKLILATTLVVVAGASYAQTQGMMKAGLWEMKTIKQVMDGNDMQAQMQQMMASMPPEQRKQMGAAMAGQGISISEGNAMRMCVSPKMAANETPMLDPQGKCQPTKLSRSGNKISYEFNCKTARGSMTGKGDSTRVGDTITTAMDMMVTDPSGKHTMQTESQMTYLGADCGTLKPIE